MNELDKKRERITKCRREKEGLFYMHCILFFMFHECQFCCCHASKDILYTH